MKAVILAAGLGKRLHPITKNMSKSMIPICGKPVLEYIILELSKHGFDDFCLIVGHKQDSIRNYFNDGKDLGVHIQCIEQEKLRGTAHALMLAKDFVDKEQFLLYLSDTIISEGLDTIIPNMKISSSFFEIVSSKIATNLSKSVGQILVKDNFVTQILEKPTESISNYAWAGIAFFKNQQIFEIIEDLQVSKTGEFEITEALNMALNKNYEIRNHLCKEFVDFGTIAGLLKINKFFLSKENFKNSYGLTTADHVYVGKNCKIDKNVSLESFVSIGNNVTIGKNCKIQNSLILDNMTIEENQEYDNAIISSDGILITH